MALDRLKYDVWPHTRELDQLGNLFYVERLLLEVDANDETITATFAFEAGDYVPSGVTNSARGMLEIAVNRLGPLNSVELTPITLIEWYGVELFVRPVMLGVNIVESGQRVVMPGRTSDAATSLIFDINPFSFPDDARHVNPVIRRMWVDAETGDNTITPTLNYTDGTSATLTAISDSSRVITEYSLLSAKRIKNITLAGDFADGEIILYDFEIDIYLPSQRRMALG